MRRPLVLGGTVAVGIVVMVAGLLAAGGAPQRPADGLLGAGLGVSWAVPVLRILADGAAVATGGAVLAVLLFLPAKDGKLGSKAIRACQDAALAAGIWAVASIGGLIATAAVILGIPLSHLAEHAGPAGQLNQVRALAVTVVLTAVLAVILSGTTTLRTARLAALLTIAALIGPLLTGHGAIDRTNLWSLLATASLVVHVVAATAWVGGLAAVLRYARSREAVEIFSTLALSCAVTMGVTGLLTAEIHLGGRQDGWGLITQWVTTGYGVLVLGKTLAFAALVFIGRQHRRSALPRLTSGDPAVFRRLAVLELLVMAGTIGLAVALARTP
ncbi:CopD family protein [Kribbella shirazensis]|jgi:putative copper export protein|uniref:Putative copper export protein n=1 Tax=Kribbella shirazensis TaxID=1105143 RepID=A0A7X6A184_9ACTN|nr:CopD family protein [Kribbella shirazensis]NIK56884.1 putative copper export protein [Kribbella shirazensis]